jgi:RNA polymerase sigma factor (sigma-70 family)
MICDESRRLEAFRPLVLHVAGRVWRRLGSRQRRVVTWDDLLSAGYEGVWRAVRAAAESGQDMSSRAFSSYAAQSIDWAMGAWVRKLGQWRNSGTRRCRGEVESRAVQLGSRPGKSMSPVDVVQGAELSGELRGLLPGLTGRVFDLVCVDGLSLVRASRELRIDRGTASRRLAEIRERVALAVG